MSYQQTLERLNRLYEFRDLIVAGRRKGFLEHDEALKLVRLLRCLVMDLSGGEAKLTLYLIDVVERMINNPGPLMEGIALEKFGRGDVLPMPEHLAISLPEPTLLKIIRASSRGPIGGMLLDALSHRLGVSSQVLEALLNIRLKDLVSELGYLFESLLHIASNYAEILENYILTHGVGELKLSGTTISAFAEVTARAWLTTVLKGPWARAEPIARQTKRAQYEFDAVSVERVEDRAEVRVAEVEVQCHKFLEPERRKTERTSIEGKVQRLKHLLETIEKAYRELGARKAYLAELLLICFDKPEPKLKEQVLSKAKATLEKLCTKDATKPLYPSFSPEKSIKLYTGDDILQKLSRKPPENRLREVVEYIIKFIGTAQQ